MRQMWSVYEDTNPLLVLQTMLDQATRVTWPAHRKLTYKHGYKETWYPLILFSFWH